MDGHEAHESLRELPQGHSGAQKSVPQRVPSLAVARRVHGVAQEAVLGQSDGQPASMTGFEGAAVVQLNRSKSARWEPR